MKILLLAALIELPDNDTEPEPAPVPNPTPFSPDELFRRLMLEVREGRNPEIWSDYGPIFQI